MVMKQYSNGLSADRRADAASDGQLGKQACAPTSLALGRRATGHGNDLGLLASVEAIFVGVRVPFVEESPV